MLSKSLADFVDGLHTPSEESIREWTSYAEIIHQEFQKYVEKYRGDKIKLTKAERDEKIYDARIYQGDQAKEIGLVDEVGNMMGVLAQQYPECRPVLCPKNE